MHDRGIRYHSTLKYDLIILRISGADNVVGGYPYNTQLTVTEYDNIIVTQLLH